MTEWVEALWFARRCFQIFRKHQRSVEREAMSTYTVNVLGVPRVALMLATGREAWRVSDFAANFYARRGVQ